MIRHYSCLLALACPLFTVVACDDVEQADDAVAFRCPVGTDCSGGGYGNTSYSGTFSLANFNTSFGVHAPNSVFGQESESVLTGASIWHNGALRQANSVWVTADGELRLSYPDMGCTLVHCPPIVLTGAQLVGAQLEFDFYVDGALEESDYWVKVHAYQPQTIHGKPGHVYTLLTNAPGEVEWSDDIYYLCLDNDNETYSPQSVFLPGMQLDADNLSFSAVAGSAVIACKSGADGKMVLGYGYHPTDLALPNIYTAALKMTTGDICGGGYAYTTPGRIIDIQDTLGVHAWGAQLPALEGWYSHEGMICRGQEFRGGAGQTLNSMVLQAPCLQEMPFCEGTAAPQGAVFGVKVEGASSM